MSIKTIVIVAIAVLLTIVIDAKYRRGLLQIFVRHFQGI
jgi:hypothetical protein